MGVGHITANPQDRSREIQYRVTEQTGKNDPVKDLEDYLKYRTRDNSQNEPATHNEILLDLDIAIAYLEAKEREASPFFSLFSRLANQLLLFKSTLARSKQVISEEDAITLTELIYRTVYHAELLSKNRFINEINHNRAAKLAQQVARLGKAGEIFCSIICEEHIPTDADVRGAGIQEYVRRKGENAVEELKHYLKYRTNTAETKLRKATDAEKMADLATAKIYLVKALPSSHTSLLTNLAKQIDVKKISPQNAPAVTELIYRAVYHVECLARGEVPNPINAKRGGKLAKRISRDPNLKLAGGTFGLLFWATLTTIGVLSFVGTLGLSAPVSGALIGVGLFGMYGAKKAKQGRQERAANYHKIGGSSSDSNSSPSKVSRSSQSEKYVVPDNDCDAHARQPSFAIGGDSSNQPTPPDSPAVLPVEPVIINNQGSVVESPKATFSQFMENENWEWMRDDYARASGPF